MIAAIPDALEPSHQIERDLVHRHRPLAIAATLATVDLLYFVPESPVRARYGPPEQWLYHVSDHVKLEFYVDARMAILSDAV